MTRSATRPKPALFMTGTRDFRASVFATFMLGFAVMVGMAGVGPDQTASAQAPSATALTAERVFSDPSLNGPRIRGLAFGPDGKILTFIRPKADDFLQLDLWSRDIESGAERILIDSRALNLDESGLSETEKARRERQRITERGVVEYAWSKNGQAVLVPVAGDLFLADPQTGQTKRLTQSPKDEIDARLSPDAQFVMFVRDQDLWKIDIASGKETRLTTDGGGNVTNGLAEFVAQEELDRLSGFWIAPDTKRVLYAKVDESRVDLLQRADISAKGTRIVDQKYPRAGTRNADVSLHLIDLSPGGKDTKLDLGFGLPDQAEFYLARIHWSPDSRFFLIERLTRDQKRLDLLRVDIQTGATRILLSETDPHWVNLNNDFRFLERESGFIWASERDGFNHLYVYDAEGKPLRRITKGPWSVAELEDVDEAKGLVFFTANQDDVTQTQLYSVALKPGKKSANPTRITQAAGSWAVNFSPRHDYFVGTYSDSDIPPQVGLFDTKGTLRGDILANRVTGDHPWAAYQGRYLAPQFGKIRSSDGSTDLYYEMRFPVGFDRNKKYPAIQLVYGGPHVQTVLRAWGRVAERLYLEAGYVTFRIDNRGSANRGKAFETPIHRAMAGIEVKDQYQGLDWLKSQPFIDADHIGVTGWSYGGYMTLMLMLQEPGRFAAGIAGAPVTDWSLYDTAYTERYMETPQLNTKGYSGSSVLSYADRLAGPILLEHGMADDNVFLDNSVQLISAWQRSGKAFELMLYPGEKHRFGPKAINQHLWENQLRFFNAHLKRPDAK